MKRKPFIKPITFNDDDVKTENLKKTKAEPFIAHTSLSTYYYNLFELGRKICIMKAFKSHKVN